MARTDASTSTVAVVKCDECGEELDKQLVHTMHADLIELSVTNQGVLRPRYTNVQVVCLDCTEKKKKKETDVAKKVVSNSTLKR